MDIVMKHEPDTLYDSLPALAGNDEVPIDILDRQETVLPDSIDEYTQFFSGEVKEKLQSGFVNTAKQVMKKVACSFIENKVGIDADDLSDFVEKVQEATSQETHAHL